MVVVQFPALFGHVQILTKFLANEVESLRFPKKTDFPTKLKHHFSRKKKKKEKGDCYSAVDWD